MAENDQALIIARGLVSNLKSSYFQKYKRYEAKIFSEKVNHAIQHFNILNKFETGRAGTLRKIRTLGMDRWNDPTGD